MSLIHSLKWSFLSELAAKAIQPVVFIVLARLLTPEDFGVMTAAMMVIAFSQIFWEAGMGKALVQRQTHIEEAANAAFMINIGMGFLISGLLYLFAQPVAQIFFQDERVTAVLQVMTLQVLLGALGSVQTALLQKEMGFKKLFWVRFATVSLPGWASIPLAMNGWGYWALVVGTLAGQFAQVIMLWRMSHWRPGFTRDSAVTKEIAKFGAWVGATGLLSWFYGWGDSLFVGKFLGLSDLGLYRLGQQCADLLYSFVFAPVVPVIYARFSRFNHDKYRVRQETDFAVKMGVWIAIPMSLYLFAYSGEFARVFFGVKWIGLGSVIGLMVLRAGVANLTYINGDVYRVLGRPNLESIVLMASLLFYLPVYIVSIKYGLGSFLLGRIALVVGSSLLHFVLLKRFIGVNLFSLVKLLGRVTLISGAALYVISFISFLLEVSDVVLLFFSFSMFLLVVCFAFYWFERNGAFRVICGLVRGN